MKDSIKINDNIIKEITVEIDKKKYYDDNACSCKGIKMYKLPNDDIESTILNDCNVNSFFNDTKSTPRLCAILEMKNNNEKILVIGEKFYYGFRFKYDNINDLYLILLESNVKIPLFSRNEKCSLHLCNFNTSKWDDMCYLFQNYDSVLFNILPPNFDIKSVTNMKGMFKNAKCHEFNLSEIFKGGNVQNIEDMFAECKNLTEVNLINMNFNSVKNARHMFYNCENLEKVIVNETFIKAIEVSGNDVFDGCYKLRKVIIPLEKQKNRKSFK